MASQPSNTSISVYRQVRAFRNDQRLESIKAITGKLRNLVLSVPAQEDRVEVKGRDTTVQGTSSYFGQAAAGATRGFPVVVGTRAAKDLEVVETLSGVDFIVTVGRDRFVTNDADSLTNDLHQQVRDA